MAYVMLDDQELLRLALEAMSTGKDAESMDLLKALVDRDSGNAHGQYLLAAQYAQMGLMEQAEAGFRAAVDGGLEIPVARFQLGQLLLIKGEPVEASRVLEPLQDHSDIALGAYARALAALATEDVAAAIGHLRAGLGEPQEIPALAGDMRRLLGELQKQTNQPEDPAEPVMPAGASMFLSGYQRQY